MIILNYVLFFLGMMLINRLRGDKDLWIKFFPGKALYYVLPLFFGLSYLILPLIPALLMTFTYMVWAIPPWGRWFDLHRMDAFPRKDPSIFEKVIEKISFGSDHLAFFIRMLFVLIGLSIYAYFVTHSPVTLLYGIVFAAMVVVIYEFSWRVLPRYPIFLAELLTGGLWATLIILLG